MGAREHCSLLFVLLAVCAAVVVLFLASSGFFLGFWMVPAIFDLLKFSIFRLFSFNWVPSVSSCSLLAVCSSAFVFFGSRLLCFVVVLLSLAVLCFLLLLVGFAVFAPLLRSRSVLVGFVAVLSLSWLPTLFHNLTSVGRLTGTL